MRKVRRRYVLDIEAKLVEVTAAGVTVKEPAHGLWPAGGDHRPQTAMS